jgi:hypothetical protein
MCTYFKGQFGFVWPLGCGFFEELDNKHTRVYHDPVRAWKPAHLNRPHRSMAGLAAVPLLLLLLLFFAAQHSSSALLLQEESVITPNAQNTFANPHFTGVGVVGPAERTGGELNPRALGGSGRDSGALRALYICFK